MTQATTTAVIDAWSGFDTSNTSLDVTNELQDYLLRVSEERKKRLELDQAALGLSESSGVNFAEAALVLQQSTTLYGKKVDLLKTIALEACEVLAVNPVTVHNGKVKKAKGPRTIRKIQGMDATIDSLPFLSFPISYLGRFKPTTQLNNTTNTTTALTDVAIHPSKTLIAEQSCAFSDFKEREGDLPSALIPSIDVKPIEPLIFSKTVSWPFASEYGALIMDEWMHSYFAADAKVNDRSGQSVPSGLPPSTFQTAGMVGEGAYDNSRDSLSMNRTSSMPMDEISGTANRMSSIRGNGFEGGMMTPYPTVLGEHLQIKTEAQAMIQAERTSALPEPVRENAIAPAPAQPDLFKKMDPYTDLKGNRPASVKSTNRSSGVPSSFSWSLRDACQHGFTDFEGLIYACDSCIFQSYNLMDPQKLQLSLVGINHSTFAPATAEPLPWAAGGSLRTSIAQWLDPTSPFNRCTGLNEGESVKLYDDAAIILRNLVEKFGLDVTHKFVSRYGSTKELDIRKDVLGEVTEDIPALVLLSRAFPKDFSKKDDVMIINRIFERFQLEINETSLKSWKPNKEASAFRTQFRSLPSVTGFKVLNPKCNRLGLTSPVRECSWRSLEGMDGELKSKSRRKKPDASRAKKNTSIMAASEIHLQHNQPHQLSKQDLDLVTSPIPVWALEGEFEMDMNTASRFHSAKKSAMINQADNALLQLDKVIGEDCDEVEENVDDFDAALEHAQIENFDGVEEMPNPSASNEQSNEIEDLRDRVESLVHNLVHDHGLNGFEDVGDMAQTEVQDKLVEMRVALKSESNLRMKEWNQKIPKFLSTLESEKEFDIGAYRRDIVSKMTENEVAFQSLTANETQVERTRTFLTTLLMTTNGSIQIKANSNRPDSGSSGLELPSNIKEFNVLIQDRSSALVNRAEDTQPMMNADLGGIARKRQAKQRTRR